MNSVKKPRILPLFAIGIFILVIVIVLITSLRNTTASSASAPAAQTSLPGPKAQQTVNRLFTFPLKDDNGNEVSSFKYYIQNAQLQDEIIVKGEKATAIQGRTFLIINLKLTNDYDKDISVNTRNYIRLTVNNSNEKLAPDIHNDPVEIQPISTKYTRVGFAINNTDKNLVLQIGEISGPKTDIKLNFK